jgi:transcriptional regulator with GAF, ATPase, and Fis domain
LLVRRDAGSLNIEKKTDQKSFQSTAEVNNSETVIATRLRKLELISELFEICNSTSNLNELMNRVFKKVISAVNADAGSLWLINDERTELTCHVAEGPTKDKVIGLKLPKGSGVVGYVIDTAENKTVFDTSTDANFANSIDKKTGFTTRSMICAPLIVESNAIGAIQLLNKKTVDGKFDNEDLNLLRVLCQSSATPIVNARLRSSEQKVQELSTLLDISKEITSTLDLDSCLMSVVNLTSKLIPYDRAVIALNEKDTVKIEAVSGLAKIQDSHPDMVTLKNMLDGVSKIGEDVYIASCKKYIKKDNDDPLDNYIKRYHPASLAIYRLYDEESQLGLFMMESAKENLISGSISDRLAILKNMMTVALRNAQLYNSVPSLSLFHHFKSNSIKGKLKNTIIFVSVLFMLIALASIIKVPFNVPGKFEILPNKKFMLYSPLDNSIVEKYCKDPASAVKKGDTLLIFNHEELVQQLMNKENDVIVNRQELIAFQQQGKYADASSKKIMLEKMALEIATFKRKIGESYIRSPIDGRLSNDEIKNMVGRKFSRGDELIEIIPQTNLQLRVMVPEQFINKIIKDQKCQFRVPAYPGKTFKGIVDQVGFSVEQSENGNLYPVYVRITSPEENLYAGMSGKAKIETVNRTLLDRALDKPKEFVALKLWL